MFDAAGTEASLDGDRLLLPGLPPITVTGFADVSVINSTAAPENPPADIDGDGEAGALTDGILVVRFLAGFTGESLTDGAVAEQGERTGSAEIEQFLQSVQSTMLDIDDDGESTPLTDGILFLRHLAGFVGDALVNNAVNPAGNRTDPAAISEFLDEFLLGGASGGAAAGHARNTATVAESASETHSLAFSDSRSRVALADDLFKDSDQLDELFLFA